MAFSSPVYADIPCLVQLNYELQRVQPCGIRNQADIDMAVDTGLLCLSQKHSHQTSYKSRATGYLIQSATALQNT